MDGQREGESKIKQDHVVGCYGWPALASMLATFEELTARTSRQNGYQRPRARSEDHDPKYSRRIRFVLTAGLFALSLSVFIFSPVVGTSDSMFSLVLSESILHHGSTRLNWFRPPSSVVASSDEPSIPYQLAESHGNLVYLYPNGGAILSVPFVALANLMGIKATRPDGRYFKGGEFVIQKFIAALLMAILVVVVFHTSLLILDFKTSTLIAVGFAFGTQVWSEASRQLWSQTWMIFLESWLVFLLLKYDEDPGELPMVLMATLLSWMYFVRPTAAIPIVFVTSLVLRSQPVGRFMLFATTGALWFALFVVYSWLTFGDLIPGYYRMGLDFGHAWSAIAGILWSPSRGLFVYVPVSALVLYSALRHWSALPHRRLAGIAVLIILAHLTALAGWSMWWGGGCYGARLMIDVLPWFVMLAILASAEAIGRGRRHGTPARWGIAIALVALSMAMNAPGAISQSSEFWSLRVDVDRHPERVFDWSYPEFAAWALRPPPYALHLPDESEKIVKGMHRIAKFDGTAPPRRRPEAARGLLTTAM